MIEQMFGAALLVPDAVRATLSLSGWQRYALVDRGSYDYIAEPDLPALYTDLARLVREHIGRSVSLATARALRLLPGDYVLAHHDRLHADNPVEVIADLSPAPVEGAEVHYRRRGQVFFRVPSQPGAVSIVERGPTVTCNHTYVSKLLAGAVIVRVVALFR